MTTVLVRDVLERASTLLDDIDPQFTRWPERELVTWLNDGARALAKWLPPSVARIDIIRLQPGSRQSIADIPADRIKMGDGASPRRTQGVQFYEAVRNMGADGLTPGAAVTVAERAALDTTLPNWHALTGTEVENVVHDPRTPTFFYVCPTPTAEAWLEVSYCALPERISVTTPGQFAMTGTDATTSPVADAYTDDLVHYMLARAFMSRSDLAEGPQMASAYTQFFVSSINAQATALTGNNPNLSMLPFAPAPAGRAG